MTKKKAKSPATDGLRLDGQTPAAPTDNQTAEALAPAGDTAPAADPAPAAPPAAPPAEPAPQDKSKAKAKPAAEPIAAPAAASGVGRFRVTEKGAAKKLGEAGTEIRLANVRAAEGLEKGLIERV